MLRDKKILQATLYRYLRRLRIELTQFFYSYMEWTKRLSHEIYFDVFSASSGVGGEHEQ